MMKAHIVTLLLAISTLSNGTKVQGQSHWAQFRGPGSMGIAPSDDKSLPVEFNESKNMIWMCALSKGNSSPCIWENHIFLTGYEDKALHTICIDRKTGKTLWQRTITVENLERMHPINNPASPTAVSDGERVFVYFGSYGLLCYDFKGNEVWKKPMPIPRIMYGSSASPILAGDYLIFIHDSNTESYVEAIKPKTGETAWKVQREGFKGTWSTPMVWDNNGVDEVVVYGIWWMKAYDLRDGSERWSLPGLTDEPIITPVAGDGLLFLSSYNMKTNPEVIGLPEFDELLEEYDKDKDGQLTREEIKDNQSILSRYDADGEGDHPLRGFFRYLDVDRSEKITVKEWRKMISFLDSFEQHNALLAIRPSDGEKETEIVWKHAYGVPECPSPLYYEGRIYMVKNGGIVSCLDAKTGELKYQDKLRSGGPYYSSPVVGDGKIYIGSTRGVVTVFVVGEDLNVLARNELKERIMATPAIVDGKIYVRTENHLYAFGLTQ